MSLTVHAGCVLVGEAGVLVRGAPGSGKSALAREIVALARARGRFARHVADDRVRLVSCHGRLLARPVAAIAGLAEWRGVGVVAVEHEGAAVLRLVVDCLAGEPERMPPANEREVALAGVVLPRLQGRCGSSLADLVLARLDGGAMPVASI